ncbi:MAG: PD40 domain-containing protein [Vicinamibacteria bacterium]|nr:PD40 domain-containing protein [Vicinamibacteria bacterium]
MIVRRTRAPDGQGTPLDGGRGWPFDWSADGRWVLSSAQSAESGRQDITLYDLASGSQVPWLATEADERTARFSPNGKWVAYASNTNGRFDVYLRRFDGSGAVVAISTDGGEHPAWRGDGKELFYLRGNDVMSVAVDQSNDAIEPGSPQVLFSTPLNDCAREILAPYAVTRDGQRFLVNTPEGARPLLFIQGLSALMAQR